MSDSPVRSTDAPTTADGAHRPPDRPAAPTNLGRAEALWRSSLVSAPAMAVTIDLTGAPDRAVTGFPVRSELELELAGTADGLWIDFLGEEVRALSIDGADSPVSWDGARLVLPRLEAGRHTVVVEATGRYSNSGQGLHRFHDPVDGETYLYTHFEPSDARRAWPCLDQPDLKTVLTLTARHPSGWTVLANSLPGADAPQAPAQGGEVGEPGSAVVSSFAPTRPVPSYLTALAAGPWHRMSAEWRSALRPEDPAVPVSWSCRASLAEHLDEELMSITLAGLDLYDRAYGYPYPWGSYDSVLVPEYNLGAMENPGCVTFNEEAYLFRGPVTRAQHAGRANTILHEMCHMWFGDLVTPRWWEDTWLKESFAENQGAWAEAEATEYTDAWVSFASSRKAWAYLEDSRPATTHPIVATVDDVEAARQTFDGITYAKGAAVLKQLVAHLGQETFLEASRAWFREHAFGNGDLAEFLATLSAASGRDMEAWADAWLRTAGPSVLTDELETDGRVIRSLLVRQESTDPVTGREVLRPHTLVVGLYSFDASGALVRTHRLPLVLEGDSAQVPGAAGLPAPDLVTVNDEDLTYAVVRPDPASLATARQALGRVGDPMARALWWSVLHNLVRDALLAPGAFVETVLAQAGDDTDTATLATLLAQSETVALRYADGRERSRLVALLAGSGPSDGAAPGGWDRLLAAEPGSGAQLVRARAWVRAAGLSAVAGEEAVAASTGRLREVLDGGLAGLAVDTDLRWRILIALARLGAVDGAELDAALAADPSASARTHRIEALASAPSAGAKERILERVLTDSSLSNDHLDALLAAYGTDSHRELSLPLRDRGLAALEAVWSSRGQEIATRIVAGLLPMTGGRQDLAALESWLAAHGDGPAALRRLVLKGRDDLERALRARGA